MQNILQIIIVFFIYIYIHKIVYLGTKTTCFNENVWPIV